MAILMTPDKVIWRGVLFQWNAWTPTAIYTKEVKHILCKTGVRMSDFIKVVRAAFYQHLITALFFGMQMSKLINDSDAI